MEECRRFQLLSDKDLQASYEKLQNKNTVRSTNTWLNTYKAWARYRNLNENLEEYEPAELDTFCPDTILWRST